MGNQTKEEFIRYLVERFEPDEELRSLAAYLLRAVSTLRENRNTLIHASPLNAFTRYHGQIVKPHKHGHTMQFNVPIEMLEETAQSLRNFVAFAVYLSSCPIVPNDDHYFDGPSMREAMKRTLASSPAKSPLPRKIDPLPPQAGLPSDSRPPQSSRG